MAYDDGTHEGLGPLLDSDQFPSQYWKVERPYFRRVEDVPDLFWVTARTGERVALGFHTCRSVHGKAIVVHGHAGPSCVWGAKLRDGRTAHCRSAGFRNDVWRRRSDNGRGWQPGTIEFRLRDVLFTDGPLPRYARADADEATELEKSLAASPSLMSMIQDDAFANELYFILTSREVRKIGSAARETMSFGEAASMIVCLRGVGEWVYDFDHEGLQPPPPPLDRREVLHELNRVGWKIVTDNEKFEEHCEAWELLRAYEKRPALREPPEWARERRRPRLENRLPVPSIRFVPGQGFEGPGARGFLNLAAQPLDPALIVRHRLITMALSGQISEPEFADLSGKDRRELDSYEQRPAGNMPAWAQKLRAERAAIEAAALESYFPGYRDKSVERREEIYCSDLRLRLYQLAQSGRVSKAEFDRLWSMFDSDRF